MDNNPENPNNEEEFQFSEDESSPKYASTVAPSVVAASDDEKGRRKKLIIVVIGIVVGVFCIYKLYGLFTSAPAPIKPAVTMPMPAPAPVQTPKPAVITMPEEKPVQEDKTAALEQAVSENGKAQENLQNQISGLSSAIGEIQNNISMLTQQVGTLTQQMAKPVEKPKVVEKPKIIKKIVHKKAVPTVVYYLKAAISGRAWLMSSDDATFTISIGDQLPGYGEIQAIDPNKGTVTTSSGRVISFMSEDK